jgi:DNA-directed RNA polymerase subunit RPC12/RpoP
MTDYKCLDCEEIFDNKIEAVIHAVQTKHSNYQIVGLDIKMIVKA